MPGGGLTTRWTVALKKPRVTSWNISPMLTTRPPGDDRHVDELAVVLDLQAADLVLVHERQEPGVAVGSDALGRPAVAPSGVW